MSFPSCTSTLRAQHVSCSPRTPVVSNCSEMSRVIQSLAHPDEVRYCFSVRGWTSSCASSTGTFPEFGVRCVAWSALHRPSPSSLPVMLRTDSGKLTLCRAIAGGTRFHCLDALHFVDSPCKYGAELEVKAKVWYVTFYVTVSLRHCKYREPREFCCMLHS